MTGQQDLPNLEALIRAVDAGSDRLRDHMQRFEGYERIDWKPGDKIVYTLPEGKRITQEIRIKDQLQAEFPDCRVIVLEDGATLTAAGEKS